MQLYQRDPTRPGLIQPRPKRSQRQPPVQNTIENTLSESDHSENDIFPPPTRSRRYAKIYNTQRALANVQHDSDSDQSSSGDEDSDDEEEGEDDDEDAEEESDKEAEDALSRRPRSGGKGRYKLRGRIENVVDGGDEMFADIDESDDDEAEYSYNQLDMSDDEDEVDDEDTPFVNDENFMIEGTNDYEDYLNRVEGLSAYGFGDDVQPNSGSDLEPFSSPVFRRQVHFSPDPPLPLHLDQTVAPALLPSALPLTDDGNQLVSTIQFDITQVGIGRPGSQGSLISGRKILTMEDPYDSDATVLSLPPEARTTNLTALTVSSQTTAPAQQKDVKGKRRKKTKPKSPPKGFFEVDDSKPYAILGEKAQLEVFVPASGPDRPAWLSRAVLPNDDPSEVGENEATFSEMMSETPSNQHSRDSSAHSSFKSKDSISAEDFKEAFNPREPAEQDLVDLAQQSLANDFGQSMLAAMQSQFVDPEEPENEGDLPGDFTTFFAVPGDTDSDEDGVENHPSSQQSNSVFKMPALAYSQIAGNVGSFRLSTDPLMASLGQNQNLNTLPPLTIPYTSLQRGHKRKASDSPYDSPHYDGVTPVQRVIRASKRRKPLTAETTA